MDAATRSIAAGLRPGTLVVYETTLPVGTTRDALRAAARGGLGPDRRGRDFHLVFSPSGCSPAGSSPTCASTPSSSAGVDAAARPRGVDVLRGRSSTSTSAPDLAAPNGVWDLGSAEAAELAKLAETTYRDVNIGLANQFARFADAARHRRARRSSRPATPSRTATSTSPGIAVGGHCIPVYPRLYLWNDPDATVVRAAREANAAMPEYAVGAARGGVRRPGRRARWSCSARPTAAASRRRRSPACSRRRGAARARRRRRRCTTRCTPTTSCRRSGFRPTTWASQVDAAVVQADHAEYRDAGGRRLPGLLTLVDGRAVIDAERFAGVNVRVVGRGAAPRSDHR